MKAVIYLRLTLKASYQQIHTSKIVCEFVRMLTFLIKYSSLLLMIMILSLFDALYLKRL